MSRIVTTLEEVQTNIATYNASLAGHHRLAARISQHPAWYAIKDEAGNWRFGPSKFIGYAKADADSYLSAYSRRDGKESEPVLQQWFLQVDLESALGRELKDAFRQFADAFDKAPNSRWRVSVPHEYLADRRNRGMLPAQDVRIAFDPEVCGGRPHIRGTRIRVSDIVAALAEGETAQELLADFPYLADADIAAALRYAANAVDHRVLVAA